MQSASAVSATAKVQGRRCVFQGGRGFKKKSLCWRVLMFGESPHLDHVARRETVVSARGQACTMPQQELDGSFVAVETGHVQGGSALGVHRVRILSG